MDQARLDAGNILTHQHRDTVKRIMINVATEFLQRAVVHDDSKLEAPEVEMFAEYGPKLRGVTYDPNNPSSEYEEYREKMDEALVHHYSHNSHHPEHFPLWRCPKCGDEFQDEKPCEKCKCETDHVGWELMNLLDLLEMFCDWKAATLRHADGDLAKSVVINTKRFNLSPQLARIFTNTIALVDNTLNEDDEIVEQESS